jgi:hypothetical protein
MYKLYITMFIRKIKKKSGTYLAKVESYRDEDGRIKQRVIEYLGKEIDGKPSKRVLKENIEVKNVKRSLDVLAIDKIAEELGLKNIKNRFALSLVYSQLLEKRSISKLENWMRYTEIPEMVGIDKISVKRLYESLTELDDEEFKEINSKMFEVFEKHEKVSDAAVIDITDTYFNGSKINIKKRRGKEERISKLIQVGLAVSFKNGFPIFYKQYQGNLHGMDIFKDMSIELRYRGLKSIIVDRGMLSIENLKLATALKFKVIAGVKKNINLIKKFISKIKRDEIYKFNNMVKLKNTAVFIKTIDYLDGKMIVVYNPSLEVFKNQLNFNKGTDSKKDIGYTLIFHNTNYESNEVVRKYYDKDIIERAFKQLKGVLNLRPIRLWLTDHIEGHLKICYLAYAVLALMNYKLRKMKISAIDALDSLRYGYKIILHEKNSKLEWPLFVPLEPKQTKILKKLKVMYKN